MHICMFHILPILFIWGTLKIFADEYLKIRKKKKFDSVLTDRISNVLLFILIVLHFAKYLFNFALFLFLFLIELILGVIFSITFVASSIERESI